MQAASRESFAAALEALNGAARRGDAAAVAGLADELLAVAGLLRREPRLRRALSDPARDGADRAELLSSLLSGQVSEPARALLGTLVSGRWSRPGELLDATELLGVESLLASAERGGDLAEVEDELFRFGRAVAGTPQLAGTLADSSAAVDRRVALVRDLLADKAKPATVRLAELAVTGFGGRGSEASLARLVELAGARRDRQIAYVTAAAPLPDDEERRLETALARIYRRDISLKVIVDPEVVGGLSVRVGHDLYDGTILRRLGEARTALAGR